MLQKQKFFLSKKTLIVFLFAVVIVFLHFVRVLEPVEGFFVKFFSPIQKFFYSAGSGIREFRLAFFWSDIVSENRQLKERLQKSTIENNQLKLEIQKLTQANEHIAYLSSHSFRFIVANIIGREFFADRDVLIIDRGKKDGIKAGLPAVVDEGVIIGRVVEVGDTFSKILLLTDPQSRISASLQGRDGVQGIVSGASGFFMKMELIPREEEISPEEVVVTAGLEENIPRGLIVGRILQIEDDKSPFFRNASVEPFIPYHSLTFLSILIP